MLKKALSRTGIVLLALSLSACGAATNSSQSSQGTQGTEAPKAETQAPAADAGKKVEKVTLTLSTPDPDTASITVAAKEFAKLVNEKSNGSIEVKVFPSGSLYGADPSAAVKQLGAGSLDMLTLSTSLYANFEPKFSAISIPYLFDDRDQFMKYLNGEPGEELLKSIDSLGIHGLGYWARNFRQITNSKQPINEPKDLQGIRLRVPNNPLWVEFFGATGAVTTPMAFGEVYNALQLKTIDGQENPAEIPKNAKFYEVQKYLSVSNHMADGWVVAMNKDKFSKLAPEQQQVLAEATKEIQAWALDYDQKQEAEAINFLKEKGMEVNTITPENQQKFVEVSKQLYPKFQELVKDEAFFQTTLKFVGKE